MVVGSDDRNAKERKCCEIWGKRHVRLESRAGRRPLSACFFSCLSVVWALGQLFSFALAPVRLPGAKKSFPVGARDSRSVVLTP